MYFYFSCFFSGFQLDVCRIYRKKAKSITSFCYLKLCWWLGSMLGFQQFSALIDDLQTEEAGGGAVLMGHCSWIKYIFQKVTNY